MNLDAIEIKAFVPARDFELSKRFYADLGFSIPWSGDDLAYLHLGNCSFLLQKFYVKEHAGNFMIFTVFGLCSWRRTRNSSPFMPGIMKSVMTSPSSRPCPRMSSAISSASSPLSANSNCNSEPKCFANTLRSAFNTVESSSTQRMMSPCSKPPASLPFARIYVSPTRWCMKGVTDGVRPPAPASPALHLPT